MGDFHGRRGDIGCLSSPITVVLTAALVFVGILGILPTLNPKANEGCEIVRLESWW